MKQSLCRNLQNRSTYRNGKNEGRKGDTMGTYLKDDRIFI